MSSYYPMPVDYSTPRGLVRLNITDTSEDEAARLFTDDQLDGLLAAAGDNVNRATARALHIIATSEVLISKKIRTQDLQTDGPAVARSLMDQAAVYEAKADAEDGATDFAGYIPPTPDAGLEAEEWRW
ncbi:MAG: hypothetical protein QJR09_08185 [Micrococcus sp.]|nr:hypothetical protein [Micrococcus sp.]